jgi:hypothetical protein
VPLPYATAPARRWALAALLLSLLLWAPARAAGPTLASPILFVTQVPVRADFTTIGSVFGNHKGDLSSAIRGGDLWIRYPDGNLKNLTAAAGYGVASGLQGAGAIAVRDPAVYWDATKAVFSMVVGAPTQQYQTANYYWQLYEITGLGQSDTPVITKVPNQPAGFNNVSPIYGTDDRIIFTSDRPRNGAAHLYPQLDEYETAPTNTGLWSLDPASGDLRLLNHAPSGDFTPTIDSFGRVIFTQWDHLQRDQQADADAMGTGDYGTFNYADESANAARLASRAEVFPEPRAERTDLLAGTNLVGHSFNHFFPWQVNEDGTESEVLNHLGRHELHGYLEKSINGDPNVVEYYGQYPRFNPNRLENMLQIEEDPAHPGRYYGIDAPEFSTHASGQIVSLDAPPSTDPDHIAVTYVTHRDTSSYTPEGGTPTPNNSGHYRDPLPLSDGTLIAAHTAETRADAGSGGPAASRYDFRLKTLVQSGGYWVAGQALTAGIVKSVSWWDPDTLQSFSGNLWELSPVEVRARTRPQHAAPGLASPEQQIFQQAGVDPAALQADLAARGLALVVSRNVTRRDDLDKQQPFNLRIAGGGAQTVGAAGKIYDLSYIQFFQADQLRGLTFGGASPRAGRRVLAQPMHDSTARMLNLAAGGPLGATALGADGSMAAFVPARRAMTWQLTDAAGTGVVRERYWLTFQPGEVRVCASCHGLSQYDQAGQTTPTNPPAALRQLLLTWKVITSPSNKLFLPLARH